MKSLITRINREVKCPIDVHCHNDFGLAVANTIAAVEAGASQVQVTVNGIGERAGNADLAQTVMIMESMYRIRTGIKKERLVETSRSFPVQRSCDPAIQPVVGENVFSHESGIHSHGVLRNSHVRTWYHDPGDGWAPAQADSWQASGGTQSGRC